MGYASNTTLISDIPASFFTSPSCDKRITLGVSFTPAIVSSPEWEFGIQPGVEYKINKKFSFLAEVAFSTYSHRVGSSNLNRKYFRIKPEFRYLLRQSDLGSEKYIALQFSYSFRSFRNLKGGSYFDNKYSADTSATAYDQAKIISPVTTISILYSDNFLISKNFSIDVFTGIGARFIITRYEALLNPRAERYQSAIDRTFLRLDPAYRYFGNLSRFQFTIGVRLLYRFGDNYQGKQF